MYCNSNIFKFFIHTFFYISYNIMRFFYCLIRLNCNMKINMLHTA